MATHYMSTTKSASQELYGIYGSWKNVTHKINVSVTVSAVGAVSFTITSSCSSQGNLSLWVEINGCTVVPTGYYGWFTNSSGNSYFSGPSTNDYATSMSTRFPYNNNSTCSGTAGTVSGGSVSVKIKLIKGSSYSGWPDAWNSSLKSESLTRNYWTDVTAGTVSIADNYNNSFTVTCTSGTAGTNNPIIAQGMWIAQYKNADGSWMWSNEDKTTLSKTITLDGLTNSGQREVAGYLTSYATYGTNANTSNTAWINQYRPPSDVKNLRLTPNSFKNNRLTIKQNWTYSWDPAEPANATSPVAGYRIRIYKNGAIVKGVVVGSGSTVIKGTGTNECIDRDGGTNCSVTFDPGPSGFDFKPGDTVKISVFAYAKNGLGQITWYVGSTYYHLWSGGGTKAVESAESVVQNSGIMRVKPAGSWKEGVVWVKVNNEWKEAEVVYAKDSNNWKEST